MTRKRNFIAAALMVFTIAAPLPGQAAMGGFTPHIAPLEGAKTSDVLDARIVCNFNGCFETGPDWREPPPDRRRPPPPPPDWGGRGQPPREWDRDRRPPPPPVMRRPPREHVRWCMDRYRSYDPGSNTYIARDGREYRCQSPWF